MLQQKNNINLLYLTYSEHLLKVTYLYLDYQNYFLKSFLYFLNIVVKAGPFLLNQFGNFSNFLYL